MEQTPWVGITLATNSKTKTQKTDLKKSTAFIYIKSDTWGDGPLNKGEVIHKSNRTEHRNTEKTNPFISWKNRKKIRITE